VIAYMRRGVRPGLWLTGMVAVDSLSVCSSPGRWRVEHLACVWFLIAKGEMGLGGVGGRDSFIFMYKSFLGVDKEEVDS